MICKNCGTENADTTAFCTECGAVLAKEQAADTGSVMLPNGITVYNNSYSWECEMPAIGYKAIFTVSRWVIGLTGGLITLILFLCVGATAGLITAGISIGVYLLSAACKLLMRGGVFHGCFSLSDTTVEITEEMNPPKNPLLFALYILFRVLAGLVRLAWLLTGQDEMYALTSGSGGVHKYCKYEKIKEMTPSEDHTQILLKKGIGSLLLLVTPEQFDTVTEELKKRCRSMN